MFGVDYSFKIIIDQCSGMYIVMAELSHGILVVIYCERTISYDYSVSIQRVELPD